MPKPPSGANECPGGLCVSPRFYDPPKPEYELGKQPPIRHPMRATPHLVALVGNANSGKTSLFNALTGLRQKVANFPGVTVERKTGTMLSSHGAKLELMDLPGLYSLNPRSPDERIARAVIYGLEDMTGVHRPDVFIYVADASQLTRHLYLCSQLLELGLPTVLALNKTDAAEKRGIYVHVQKLAEQLGVPVIPTIATKRTGIAELRVAVTMAVEAATKPSNQLIEKTPVALIPFARDARPQPELQNAIDRFVSILEQHQISSPYSVARLTLGCPHVCELFDEDTQIPTLPKTPDVVTDNSIESTVLTHHRHQQRIHSIHKGEDMPLLLAMMRNRPAEAATIIGEERRLTAELARSGIDAAESLVRLRHSAIAALCKRVIAHQPGIFYDLNERLDRVFLHRFWGWPIFGIIMVGLFYAVFSLAAGPMDAIDSGVAMLADWIAGLLPEGFWNRLITEGFIGGVGAVLIFLPQILLLFLFIGLMESSGYMGRAASLLDRPMRKLGLSGHSFVPLLSSHACAIPGIMATRTIADTRERLLTIFIAPFMSCSARIPVYALLIAALLPTSETSPNSSHLIKALMMFGMYLLGIFGAILTTYLSRWIFKTHPKQKYFTIELPPYHAPKVGFVLRMMLERGYLFLKNAGTVILALSLVLFLLRSVPVLAPSTPGTPITQREQIEQSLLGKIGRAVHPIFRPLGYDWEMSVGILTSFAAREVFVTTMSILYSADDVAGEDAQNRKLTEKIRHRTHADGAPVFSIPVCISLLVFYCYALQCMATVAIVRHETKSWRWPIFQFAYMLVFAYLAAWIAGSIASATLG